MEHGIRIGSLATLALADLVALVNRAYADYPGPFSPEEPEGYAAFCRVQAIDLARSVVARDAAGVPVGFGLLGMRQARGWIGEFGVVPAWRRRGVGRALLGALLAEAGAAGLHDVRLEVAGANAPAQQLYAAAGFRVARRLHNYSATAGGLDLAHAALPADTTLVAVEPDVLAQDLGLLADAHPAWDHELPALLTGGPGRTLLAQRAGEPLGLLHYTPDPADVEIGYLAVRPDAVEVARALLAGATGNPAARLLIAYVGEDSPLFRLLPALGFGEIAPDLEMICEPAPPQG